MRKRKNKYLDARQLGLAEPYELDPDIYPYFDNVSGAFIFQFVPLPKEQLAPEFVYLDWPKTGKLTDERAKYELAVANWALMWEAGHIRQDAIELPESLSWLRDLEDTNIYLLPRKSFHRYDAFSPLFHLLPQRTLKQFGLPLLRKGIWPFVRFDYCRDRVIPRTFDQRLAEAFAHHIWPLINPCSKIGAFAKNEPLILLAHNLDFWLPYAYQVAEARLRTFSRVEIENAEQEKKLAEIKALVPDSVLVERPRMGGAVWAGEADAWEATKEIVGMADKNGKLRGLIDAVRSNRVEDDFSDLWSYERIDFERKLYKKRSKVRVSFVELDDTIPVHGAESEAYENLLWEDFLAILNMKERSITVCLRNGMTSIGDISAMLGYANHSPVSKALKTIRQKVALYLDLN